MRVSKLTETLFVIEVILARHFQYNLPDMISLGNNGEPSMLCGLITYQK